MSLAESAAQAPETEGSLVEGSLVIVKFSILRALPVLLLSLFGAVANAQAPDPAARPALDRAAMQRELDRLAGICDQLQLLDEAATCRVWLVDELRADQRTLYLPVALPVESASDPRQASWCRHFIAARRDHARWLYAEARRLAGGGDEVAAFQKLWHVLREDPDHAEAQRVLGPLASAAQVRPRLRGSTASHPQFSWPGPSYRRIQTPHFLVTTRAKAKESLDISQQLEAAHALWSQLFFEQWAEPGQLAGRLAGGNQPWKESRKMEVILLRDRDDYLETLGVREKNIGVSVGYYNAQAKQSYFYPHENLAATFFHELTHQLFAEASRVRTQADAGARGGVWMLEGIALYMESLTPHDTYWTVGGIEAKRLQTARYRAVRDGYWPAWTTFTEATIDQWKADPDVALFYAHAAGLTHAFMDLMPDRRQSRQAFMQALTALYEGRSPASPPMLAHLASDEPAAQLAYQQLMTVSEVQLNGLLESGRLVSELVLAGSEFQSATWQALSRQTELQWLDVSFSNCTSSDLSWIGQATALERLSVEGTAVDGLILSDVARLPKLNELDLSGCAIEDADLQALRGQATLRVLWLTNTPVTDAILETLATLPNLQSCDVGGTRITPAAWQAFLRQHPLASE